MIAGDGGVVVVGPAPPLRGGISAHTARLVEALRLGGRDARAFSYRRLYPSAGFPGRTQRVAAAASDWNEEILDVLVPSSWTELRRRLAWTGDAAVVLQWWHPVVAPALLAATRDIDRHRLVAVCHNVRPHEALPGATLAARALLGRCGRVVCHSNAQAREVKKLLGGGSTDIVSVGLPPLVPIATLLGARLGRPAAAGPHELEGLPEGARLVVAAGHARNYKALDVLVSAWSSAPRPPEARLLLVGESYLRGRARRRLQLQAAADPSIVIVDRYVEDAELVSILARAEVVVAAYRRASQSGVLPIAKALGVTTVVSDAGGLAEQAADARVVKAGDVGALTRVLVELLARDEGGRPGRRDDAEMDSRDMETAFLRDWRLVVEAIVGVSRP